MSGIVALVNLDGAPVGRSLLLELTAALSQSGPDGEAVWADGHVGLGHTLLHTTDRSEQERQPSTLDGEVWISADARIDGRGQLIRELVSAGRTARGAAGLLETATDDTLLLHAYRAWGERMVERLLGDFAFAIWDGRRRCLFCARDQLGVKPLFFAVTGTCLILASELDCVRTHPDVPDDLDDLAVADFLLFGRNQELHSTVFSAIQRVPPAHTLTWDGDGDGDGDGPRARRYWALSAGAEIRYRRPDDYVEHFNELLRMVVADRVRASRIGVLMSGGVDSTLVAAAAQTELARERQSFELRAHTVVFEGLIPDDEKQYAGIAAGALNIPIHYYPRDPYPLLDGAGEAAWTTPEPSPDPWPKFDFELMRELAAHCRVALTGFDGDSLCQLWPASHFRQLLQSLKLRRALSEVAWFALARRSLPPMGLRTRLRQRGQRRGPAPQLPPWMNPQLVARLELRERWERFNLPERPVGRPVRADAIELLTGPALTDLFNSYAPAYTRSPVTVCHPLLDLRMVNYMLSLPPVPWSVDKTVLRRAVREALPPAIALRPKTPLSADPAQAQLQRSGGCPTRECWPTPLENWVTRSALPPLSELAGSELLWPRLWAASLDGWLLSHGFVN